MNSYKGLRVGVVGAGFIGPAHVEALRRHGIEVVGLCEESAERAAERAEGLRLKAYPTFEAMIEDPTLNVIHITSPNFLHYPQAKAALLAGKHVVCEKPLAMDTEESAELVALAKEKNLVNAVNFNIRFYPLSQQARTMIQSGDIGDVYIVQGSYLQDWLLFPSDWNWRLEPELGGDMRAVADIGSHWLDLLTFITGQEVESVFADFKTFLPVRQKPTTPPDTFSGKLEKTIEYVEQPIHTEDYATVLLRFNGGARGVLTVSQVSAGRKNRLYYEIDGSKSALAWNSERPNELWVGHRDRPNEILMKDPALLDPQASQYASYPGGHNEGFPDTFKQLYLSVYRYIDAGDFNRKPDFATFEDGHQELLMGEAILKSAREKRWVDVK
ncbi:MAG: Gfo/Idh/MocA family oxidoreductase [Chloroflexota bacterium]|nr:Gfo/Idh/MocA family oxidoreductase [Chloroflexota bacterium]